MGMKIAVTGKGGVGKSTIVALMARFLKQAGREVLLIDADPDMNLAAILGVSEKVAITPIIELKELIAERTETEVGKSAGLFKFNPRVDDIPDKFCVEHEDLKLIVMGTINRGGGGCACVSEPSEWKRKCVRVSALSVQNPSHPPYDSVRSLSGAVTTVLATPARGRKVECGNVNQSSIHLSSR